MANIGDFVKGDQQLIATLRALRRPVVSQVMKPAIQEGTKVIQKEAKNLATPGNVLSEDATGLMKKAIKILVRISKDGLNAIGKIFVSKKQGDYITEMSITHGSKWSVIKNDWADKKVKVRWHHNPGNVAHLVEFGHGGPAPAPAHPFMRPALDLARSEALSKVINKARSLLPKIVAKVRKTKGIWK